MRSCIIALSSITYSMKGQQVLSDNAIYSKIIKLQADQTKKGCAYGLEIDYGSLDNVLHLFDIYGVNYSEVVREQANDIF